MVPAEGLVRNTNVCIVLLVESHLGELLENILCTVLAMLVSDWLFYSSLKNSALYVRARPEYLVLVHVSCSITMGIVSYPSTMSIYDISVHLRRQTTVFSIPDTSGAIK